MQLTTMPGLKRGNGSRSASVRLLSAEETSRDEPNSLQPLARQDSIVSNGEGTTIVRRGSNISISANLPLQQGVVLLEDAIHYRSIHHKLDSFSIRLYRWYHSAPVQWSLYAVIFVLMFLAFLETPSSLTWSSDPRQNLTRYEFPAGILEGIDFACLFMLLISTSIQSYLIADLREKLDFPRKHPWLTGNFIVILLSFVDLLVSLNLGNDIYRLRFRRILRPYFLASSSTMLKKTLKCIRNTLPEIASVLTLLLLHVYFFVMLGMLCFPKGGHSIANQTDSELNDTEWRSYFSSLDNAFMSLLVLLTTANNPDVMMPAYSENRLYSIYFIVFSLFGTFLIFNLLTAIVYNQFRGYFQNSMQASHIRRCVAFSAAFTVLSDTASQPNDTNVNSSSSEPGERMMYMGKLRVALTQVTMKPAQRTAIHHNIINLGVEDGITKDDFDQIFSNIDSSVALEILQPASVLEISTHAIRSKIQHVVLHPAFNIIGNLMVLANAVIVTIEIAIHYEKAFKEVFSRLNILNYGFAVYYVIEQSLKVIALGKKYFKNVACVYDGMITIALVIIETLQLGRYGWRTDYDNVGGISLWDCARIINILVILRLLRIIPNFKPMAVVTTTLLEIMKNLSSFAGVLAIIYYVFAIIGMIVFEKATDPNKISISGNGSQQLTCGTYEQLQYWANNFDDFASSLVVLWDVMVVNNWGVFLDAYSRHVGEASQLYFVIWWVVSVVISINLFIALILDHFIAKWDRVHESRHGVRRRDTVQALFFANLHDPSQSEICNELSKHPFLKWYVENS